MKLRLVAIALALTALALGGWLMLSAPVRVTTVAVQRGDAAKIVYATGVVEPVTWAKVAPIVQARITELCGCEGAEVTRGQELARLDDREARAGLAELRARQDYLKRARDRVQDLVTRNIVATAELDRAESEEAQVEAAIAGQQVRLENYVLRAPSDGVILRQDGEVGEIASPGSVLFWVGERAPLQVVAEVNEEDIPDVAPGQHTLVRADAFPDRPLTATVATITPKGDPVSKTYRVRFALPDDTPLMIGMTVEVNVVVGESPDTLLIPASALAPDGSVFVAVDGIARERPVTTGIRGVARVEVTDGLSDGDRVIDPAPQTLADGARVKVTP